MGHGAAAHEPAQLLAVEDSALGPLRLRIEHKSGTPFRAFVLEDPPRMVLDVAETDLPQVDPAFLPRVIEARTGPLDAQWSRMVLTLSRPMTLAHVVPSEGALTLVLKPASESELASAAAVAPPAARVNLPERVQVKSGSIRVVIDPGHGGVDPGARRGGVAEKDLTLEIAQKISEVIKKTDGYEAILTREGDRFVLLDDRVAITRAVEADILLSIHINTVEVGSAQGATIHVPGATASDPESAALAVLENRSDARAGAEMRGAGDDVTLALNNMVRPVTHRRARAAAEEIVAAYRAAGLGLHSRPIKSADFRVLRAPDVPSVLIELGFLSDPADRARLTDPDWQARVARAIVAGLDGWIVADRTMLSLMRN